MINKGRGRAAIFFVKGGSEMAKKIAENFKKKHRQTVQLARAKMPAMAAGKLFDGPVKKVKIACGFCR